MLTFLKPQGIYTESESEEHMASYLLALPITVLYAPHSFLLVSVSFFLKYIF